nr:AlpA family transcriptional regulator [Candidatus Palauibacter soopunensis]
MKTLEGHFRSRLDAFIESTGMPLSTLGRRAIGDPNLMREIARGRSPTLRTADRILAYTTTYERERHRARYPPRRRSRRRKPRANRTRRSGTMTESPKDPRTTSPVRLLRRPEVEARTGLSRSSIYARMAEGTFPRPVRLGKYGVAWIEAEIDEWVRNRISAGRTAERPSSTNQQGKDEER